MLLRTLFLSRLLGLYFLVCGLAMIVHRQVVVDAMAKLTSNPAAMLCLSVFTLIAGLAMVLGHNIWTTSPAAVIVTLLGWLTLIKGVVYLLLPAKWLVGFSQAALNSGTYFYSATAFVLVLGAYLTYEGFKAKPA